MIQTIFSLTKVLDKKALTGLEKREELFRSAQKMTIFAKINDENSVVILF